MSGRIAAAVSWHGLDQAEVIRLLDTSAEAGLTAAEAARRLREFGPNRITPRKKVNVIRRFLREFHDPLVYILLIASVITLWLGEYVDASVIFGVVIINAWVGFLQEAKSENAIEALNSLIRMEVSVRREGVLLRIPSEDLVPGDVVLLQSGNRVPADARLFAVKNLQVD